MKDDQLLLIELSGAQVESVSVVDLDDVDWDVNPKKKRNKPRKRNSQKKTRSANPKRKSNCRGRR
jgi:hypothetical protein